MQNLIKYVDFPHFSLWDPKLVKFNKVLEKLFSIGQHLAQIKLIGIWMGLLKNWYMCGSPFRYSVAHSYQNQTWVPLSPPPPPPPPRIYCAKIITVQEMLWMLKILLWVFFSKFDHTKSAFILLGRVLSHGNLLNIDKKECRIEGVACQDMLEFWGNYSLLGITLLYPTHIPNPNSYP